MLSFVWLFLMSKFAGIVSIPPLFFLRALCSLLSRSRLIRCTCLPYNYFGTCSSGHISILRLPHKYPSPPLCFLLLLFFFSYSLILFLSLFRASIYHIFSARCGSNLRPHTTHSKASQRARAHQSPEGHLHHPCGPPRSHLSRYALHVATNRNRYWYIFFSFLFLFVDVY